MTKHRFDHNRYSPSYIRGILRDAKTIAIVGASANDVRPSFFVLKYLIEKGYEVYPINPSMAGKSALGREFYASLADVPVAIDMVDVFRGGDAVQGIVDEALQLSPLPKVIWMQLGVRNDEAAQKAEAKGINVVMNRCPKMEYGKHSGEWQWIGGNTGLISSKKQKLHSSGRVQSLGI
ncbi:MAG: CoA-binding protein [Rhizobiales bacterium]|nr:CoA-binding protein [Hyphomicrobiales bacterium]